MLELQVAGLHPEVAAVFAIMMQLDSEHFSGLVVQKWLVYKPDEVNIDDHHEDSCKTLHCFKLEHLGGHQVVL